MKRLLSYISVVLLILVSVVSVVPITLHTVPVLATTTDVFRPDAHVETSSVDGYVITAVSQVVWATIKIGNGTGVDDTSVDTQMFYIASGTTSLKFTQINRCIFLFNTAAIPDDATVTSVTLSIWGNGKDDSLNITPTVNVFASAPASSTVLASSDFQTISSTALATAITYANWSTTGWNTFTFNSSGIALVSKTGVSKFATREGTYDAGSSTPAWSSSKSSYVNGRMADFANTDYDPYLSVTYTHTPTVTTATEDSVTPVSAVLNGNLTDTGGLTVTLRGFDWGVSTGVYIYAHVETSAGFSTGVFELGIADLTPSTTYYFRAKAYNSMGWGYGNEDNLATPATYIAGDPGYDIGYSAGYSAGEAAHADDYDDGYAAGEAAHADDYADGQAYGESLHVDDYDNGYDDGYIVGQAYGEGLHADDYDNGYAAGEAAHATDYADGQAYGESLHANDYSDGFTAGEAAHATDYADGYAAGQIYGESLHATDYDDGYAAGELAHATDYDDGYTDGYAQGLIDGGGGPPPDPPDSPVGLTATRSADGLVILLSWTIGGGSSSTLIKGSTTGYPTTPTDGDTIYYGPDSTYSDSVTFASVDKGTPIYYSAWSHNTGGYSVGYATSDVKGGNLMLLIALILLCCFLTYFSGWRRFLPISMGGSIAWLGLGVLWLISPTTVGVDSTQQWTQYFGYLFILLTVVPILLYIRPMTTLHREKTVTDQFGRPITRMGFTTQEYVGKKEPTSAEIQANYKARLRGLGGKRGR